MTSYSQQPSAQSGPRNLFGGFSSLSTQLTDRLGAVVPGANLDNIISGFKNILPANKDLTLTKITESIMDPTTASSSAIAKTENYLYFDPRSANARGSMPPPAQGRHQQQSVPGALGALGPGTNASFGQRRQGFSEAVVFAVGGGSMDEYGNLQDWAKRTGQGPSMRRRVVYGSTEIVRAEEFVVDELGRLGREAA